MTYHINAKGDPGKCSAQAGNCPFGGSDQHYESQDDARQAFERAEREKTLAVTIRSDGQVQVDLTLKQFGNMMGIPVYDADKSTFSKHQDKPEQEANPSSWSHLKLPLPPLVAEAVDIHEADARLRREGRTSEAVALANQFIDQSEDHRLSYQLAKMVPLNLPEEHLREVDRLCEEYGCTREDYLFQVSRDSVDGCLHPINAVARMPLGEIESLGVDYLENAADEGYNNYWMNEYDNDPRWYEKALGTFVPIEYRDLLVEAR